MSRPWAVFAVSALLALPLLGRADAPLPETPTISILESGETGLSWSTISPTVEHPLTLVESGNKVGGKVKIQDLHLSSGDLETVLAPTPAEFDLRPGAAVPLKLAGKLPSVGTWTGKLVLERPGGHEVIPVAVTREVSATVPTLEVLAPPVVKACASSLPVSVRLSEPGHRPVTVSALALVRLLPPAHAADGTASIQAETCWSRVGDPKPCQADSAAMPVSLEPGGTASWTLRLVPPKEAGTYTGTIEARTLEGDAIPDATFSFSVKHPAWRCLLMVALGVVLSALLRGWLGKSRAEAVAAIPLAKLSDGIRALARDRIRTLFELALDQLHNSEAPPAEQAAELARLQTALRNVIAVRRVLDLSSLLPELVPDGPTRQAIRADMDALAATLVDLGALADPAQGPNAAVAAAERLYERIRAAAAAATTAAMAALRNGVVEARARLPAVADPRVRASLAERLDAVEAPLAETGVAVELSEEGASRTRRLATARAALAQVASDLDAALPSDNAQMGEESVGGTTFQQLLASLGVPMVLPALSFGRPPIHSERGLRAWIRSMDALVIVVVLGLAGTFALYELWWKSDTWGDLGDYLTAFGWGFSASVLGRAASGAPAEGNPE